ncbi:hypothetical protein GCM10027589_43370 [Actinocorallia lasiicapitis]
MISRRSVLSGTAFAALSALPVAVASPAILRPGPGRPARRPNVLVLVTDDQPGDTLWALPKLRRHMERYGIAFTEARTTTPLCAPARSSILTGRYAHRHGVRDNEHPLLLDPRTTLQHRLRETGYRTGMVGKYLNGWRAGDAPPGFEKYAVMARPRYEDAVWNVDGTQHKRSKYTTTVVREEAVRFLREGDDRPWFLYVAPYAPHAPFQAEPKYAGLAVPEWRPRPSAGESDRSDKPPYIQASGATSAAGQDLRAKQLRALRSVDDLFAAMIEELARAGSLDDTVIAVVSDNGYSWSDHGWMRKSVPYAPAVRVPMWLSWPARLPGGADRRLAANIDLAATLLEAARAEPLDADGRSLLSPWEREVLLVEWWNGREKTANQPPTWASALTHDRQYIEYYDTVLDDAGLPTEGTGAVTFRESYDLVKDPHQLTNLLADDDATSPLAGVLRDLRLTGAR